MYILCVYIIHCFVIPPYLKLMSCIIFYIFTSWRYRLHREDTDKKSISIIHVLVCVSKNLKKSYNDADNYFRLIISIYNVQQVYTIELRYYDA